MQHFGTGSLKGDEFCFKVTYEKDGRTSEKVGLYLISDSCYTAVTRVVLQKFPSAPIA